MAYGNVSQYGNEVQKEIGKIVVEESNDHTQLWRIAICADARGNAALDIREYLDTQRGKPFQGLTRRGTRLYRPNITEFLAYMKVVQKELGITDEEVAAELERINISMAEADMAGA